MYERFHVSHPADDDVTFARDAVSDLNVGIMNTSELKLCCKWHFLNYIYCFNIL